MNTSDMIFAGSLLFLVSWTYFFLRLFNKAMLRLAEKAKEAEQVSKIKSLNLNLHFFFIIVIILIMLAWWIVGALISDNQDVIFNADPFILLLPSLGILLITYLQARRGWNRFKRTE